MPGLPASQRRSFYTRKKILDWELLTVIAHQVFVLRLALSIRVVEKRYFQQKKTKIPYSDLGYSDVISYLSTIQGLCVTMNSTNGQYQVEAENHQDLSNLLVLYFHPNEEDGF